MTIDTMKLALFQATARALTAYQRTYSRAEDATEQRAAYGRFCGLYDLVERLELEDEYQQWKEANYHD
ncbi:MAG: hypothetical protein LUG47_05795 [Clostridiales bacterium]|nr:hypothetical protein [Clostridiales bacterium]